MIGRVVIAAIGVISGLALASLVPGLPQFLHIAIWQRSTSKIQSPEVRLAAERPAKAIAGFVNLTAEQISAAGIETAEAQSGTITRAISAPGTIIPHADRIARISVKLSGTVAELRKKIGDAVEKDEVVAVLESREVADSKSEYLGARLSNELLQELFQREKLLWDKRVSGEQQYLRARNAAAQAKMKLDIARQKLFSLGLDESAIAALPTLPEALLSRQEIRAPLGGRIVERKVDLGAPVGRDSLESELFVVVDLQTIWVDLSVSPAELPRLHEGMAVSIGARDVSEKATGKIVFVGLLLDKETRAARVVVEVANDQGVWRPGSFVTATIVVEELPVGLAVPAAAILMIDNEKVAFVRTPEGFEKRAVVIGRAGDRRVEIVSGLRAGEAVATINNFTLKSELATATAED